MQTLRLGEIARMLDCSVEGDPEIQISGVSTIDAAGPNEITFLANKKYAPRVAASRAAAIIAEAPVAGFKGAMLISPNPYYDFARALALFHKPAKPPVGIHPTAVIDTSAEIGSDAAIGAYVVIGPHVRIGPRAILHPHAVIYEGCTIGEDFTLHSHGSIREFTQIGDRVTIHNGVVIGGDGFGFAKRSDGRQFKIPQTGTVVIEDNVEIQTLTSIDRATIGQTRIKRGAKIDSLCQIGHACVVGEDNIICGQTGLAGSTVLEENVIMAGQTGSAGHLTIHKNAIVWAQSGVGHDVPAGTIVSGSPAFAANDWLRASALLPKLPDLVRTLRTLEKRVKELESRGDGNGEYH